MPDEKGPTFAMRVFLVLNPREEPGSPTTDWGYHTVCRLLLTGPQSRCAPEHSVGGAAVGGSEASHRGFCLFEVTRTFWALRSASENS